MFLSLELAQSELCSPPENEAIAQLVATFGTALRGYKKALAGEHSGQIDSEVANEVMENITENLLILIEDALELDFGEIVEELESSGGEASEIPLETFGEAFTGLLVTDAPSYEEGLNHVAQVTGIDPSDLIDYANDRAMPCHESAMAICGCFMSCQDANIMEAIMDTVDCGEPEYNTAEMSRYNELAAEFSILAAKTASKDRVNTIAARLRSVQREADEMLKDCVITPHEYQELTPLPDNLESQDLAQFAAYFSGLCEHEGSSAEVEIDRTEYTMSFLKKRGKQNFAMLTDFSAYTDETETPDAQAQAALVEYRKRKSYG